MTTQDLLNAVEQLSTPHKKTAHTHEGFVIHERDGLLNQLREAVFGGMERTGGSSSSKAKLPISEAAVDLLELIDTQITEAWSSVFTNQVPNTDRAERLLSAWAAAVNPEAIVVVTHPEQHMRWDEAKRCEMPFVIRAREEYHPADLAHRWVAMIEDFLDPERTAGIKAACIQCGATKVSRNRDGETVLSDALVFRRDKDTGETRDARCLNCGIVWPPSQFEFLATALGLQAMSEGSETVVS